MRRRGTMVGLLAMTSVALWSCGLLGGQGGTSVASSGCSNLASSGACTEQLEKVAARHPGATNIGLTCTAAVCDRRHGSGTAVVTLANGATVNDTFAYVGDPGPLPVPSCTGIALDHCRTQAEAYADNVAPSKHIAGISVTCTVPSCTDANGDVDITGTFADGSTDQSHQGWTGSLP